MARTFTAKKSKVGKEIICRRCGAMIKPGETYFYWFRRSGYKSGAGVRITHCHLHPPRQSEKTQSKMSGVYAAVENVEDAVSSARKDGDVSGLPDALRDAASEVESVKDEYQSSLENMPEQLQQGSTGEEIQEKVNALEEFQQALESAADDLDSMDIISEGSEGEEDGEPTRDDFQKGEDGAKEFMDAMKEYEEKKQERSDAVEEACSKAEEVLGELSL